MRITGTGEVPFKDFEPVLRTWAGERVILREMKGDNAKDFSAARKVLMNRKQNRGRWNSLDHVERWEKGQAADNFGAKLPEAYTWHHEGDVETMSLVPTFLHDHIPHFGGAGKARAGEKPEQYR